MTNPLIDAETDYEFTTCVAINNFVRYYGATQWCTTIVHSVKGKQNFIFCAKRLYISSIKFMQVHFNNLTKKQHSASPYFQWKTRALNENANKEDLKIL